MAPHSRPHPWRAHQLPTWPMLPDATVLFPLIPPRPVVGVIETPPSSFVPREVQVQGNRPMGFPTIDQTGLKSCFLPKLLQNTPNDGPRAHPPKKRKERQKKKTKCSLWRSCRGGHRISTYHAHLCASPRAMTVLGWPCRPFDTHSRARSRLRCHWRLRIDSPSNRRQ